MSRVTSLVAALISTSMMTASASAKSDIMFILDGSGSMWGQIDGVTKIQTAKETMTKLMDDVPSDARIGLMTYGTRDKQSCKDVVSLNPLGYDRQKVKDSIADITPLGKTPIEFALINGISLLANAEPNDVQKSLVLVSDGIETCDGNPCSIAQTSQFSGVQMNVHVVGFDVDAEAREQLECIAKAGNGQYFDAADLQGFQDAMQAVVEVAQAEPEPAPQPVAEEPKGPTITEFFRDDFDGEELAEHWAIDGPNPDGFIVGDGVLTMLSLSDSGFSSEEPENLITYTGEMPDGDWDAEITFTGELTATGNRLEFGLRKDNKNALHAAFTLGSTSICSSVRIHNIMNSKGSVEAIEKMYRKAVPSIGNCYVNTPYGNEEWEDIVADHESSPTTLTLSKRGRAYTVKSGMDGQVLEDGSPYFVETDQFTSLRSPGTLSFAISRYQPYQNSAKGEVLFNIDSIVIKSVEE